jgi:hypothetical protein
LWHEGWGGADVVVFDVLGFPSASLRAMSPKGGEKKSA